MTALLMKSVVTSSSVQTNMLVHKYFTYDYEPPHAFAGVILW
jgi:hypothetical protein